MSNLELSRLELTTWRKIALGTWRLTGHPAVYGTLELDATKLLARRKAWEARTGTKPPTITAAVACAVAQVMKRHPQINGMIRWGRIYLRKTVTLFLQTAVDDEGKELSGVTIENAEDKSLGDLVEELKRKAQAIREDRDPEFKKTKSSMRGVPWFLMGKLLGLLSFLLYTLNLNLRSLGLPRDPGGSVMITSIGSIGLDQAYVPLVPWSRVPLLLAVGAVRDQAVVVDGKITTAPLFKLCATFDHRFMDGVYAAKMAKEMRRILETDEGLDSIGLVADAEPREQPVERHP